MSRFKKGLVSFLAVILVGLGWATAPNAAQAAGTSHCGFTGWTLLSSKSVSGGTLTIKTYRYIDPYMTIHEYCDEAVKTSSTDTRTISGKIVYSTGATYNKSTTSRTLSLFGQVKSGQCVTFTVTYRGASTVQNFCKPK